MKIRKYGIVLWSLLVGFFLFPTVVKAGSGSLQLSATTNPVEKGEIFTVVCQITSEDAFLDASFRIHYDDKMLRFVSGGKKVTGGGGMLQIVSTGNAEATYKKTFSLQFKAKKKGTVLLAPDGDIRVTDEEGHAFSMSSNRITITIVKKGNQTVPASPQVTTLPKVTPQPILSKENRLKSLKVSAVDFSPVFSPEEKEYSATVDANTDILYFSYVPQDERARVNIRGNEGLTVGVNEVTVTVTAEDGGVNTYKIKVTKESQAQTDEREQKSSEELPDVGFSIRQSGDQILLKNAYEFEVLNPNELDTIPSGYIQSTIELSGISVPAFTMEHDLDNNYLLLYLKGPSGDKALYQYDRREQTIQKYTGTMIERINKGTRRDTDSDFSVSSYVGIGIIVFLIIVILCMLIAMLKMAMKKKKPDELDF